MGSNPFEETLMRGIIECQFRGEMWRLEKGCVKDSFAAAIDGVELTVYTVRSKGTSTQMFASVGSKGFECEGPLLDGDPAYPGNASLAVAAMERAAHEMFGD